MTVKTHKHDTGRKLSVSPPYNKLLALAICISCLMSNCYTPGQSEKQIGGWKVSQHTHNARYVKSLRQDIKKNIYKQINGVVVIKDGALVIEEYFNGASRNETHDPRSVGKTFASAILGIAIDEGYINDLDQSIGEFYDLPRYQNFSEKKQKVTLRHLVTMSSGFEGNDNDLNSIGNEENMYPQADWVTWTLNLPMAEHRNPGDESVYFTAGVVLLGDILNKSVPGGLEAYADRKLFKPLGISNYQWQYTPQGVPNTAGGIRLTALDFAKFGQLYLSKGKWNNQQLISEKWVDSTMTRHYETTFDNNGYGYLMWNKQYPVDGEVYDTFYCGGNGGNKIFIFRGLNAVVVVTASAYGQSYAHPQVDDMMIKYIIPSITQLK
jgi:CubicO group peptidase (beta-lactamase class C family)